MHLAYQTSASVGYSILKVTMDDTSADTEWNDILRARGILPPKPKDDSLTITEEQLAEMVEEV